jgi:hypothetical protein
MRLVGVELVCHDHGADHDPPGGGIDHDLGR